MPRAFNVPKEVWKLLPPPMAAIGTPPATWTRSTSAPAQAREVHEIRTKMMRAALDNDDTTPYTPLHRLSARRSGSLVSSLLLALIIPVHKHGGYRRYREKHHCALLNRQGKSYYCRLIARQHRGPIGRGYCHADKTGHRGPARRVGHNGIR